MNEAAPGAVSSFRRALPSVAASYKSSPAREIDHTISPQLQEIIYRALEHDLARRYPNGS